jgi:hypothetical protein
VVIILSSQGIMVIGVTREMARHDHVLVSMAALLYVRELRRQRTPYRLVLEELLANQGVKKSLAFLGTRSSIFCTEPDKSNPRPNYLFLR